MCYDSEQVILSYVSMYSSMSTSAVCVYVGLTKQQSNQCEYNQHRNERFHLTLTSTVWCICRAASTKYREHCIMKLRSTYLQADQMYIPVDVIGLIRLSYYCISACCSTLKCQQKKFCSLKQNMHAAILCKAMYDVWEYESNNSGQACFTIERQAVVHNKASKQESKQESKQASKQASKQESKQASIGTVQKSRIASTARTQTACKQPTRPD